MRLQELQVAHLDRMLAADPANDTGHGVRVTAAIEGRSRIVDVDAFEGGGEAVRVALPAHLAVGDDVEAGPLLVDDGEHGGVVLGLFEPFRGDPPQLGGAHPRWEPTGQLGAVDQPVRLGVRTHQRGRQQGGDRRVPDGRAPYH